MVSANDGDTMPSSNKEAGAEAAGSLRDRGRDGRGPWGEREENPRQNSFVNRPTNQPDEASSERHDAGERSRDDGHGGDFRFRRFAQFSAPVKIMMKAMTASAAAIAQASAKSA
jgi:hypothetical protein